MRLRVVEANCLQSGTLLRRDLHAAQLRVTPLDVLGQDAGVLALAPCEQRARGDGFNRECQGQTGGFGTVSYSAFALMFAKLRHMLWGQAEPRGANARELRLWSALARIGRAAPFDMTRE